MLGISPTNASTRLHRTLTRLREACHDRLGRDIDDVELVLVVERREQRRGRRRRDRPGDPGRADFVLRIPSGRLDVALAALSRLGHVQSLQQSTRDIASTVNAAAARLQEDAGRILTVGAGVGLIALAVALLLAIPGAIGLLGRRTVRRRRREAALDAG